MYGFELKRKKKPLLLLLSILLFLCPMAICAQKNVEKEVKAMEKSLKKDGWQVKTSTSSLNEECRKYIMHRDAIDEVTGLPRYVFSQKESQDKSYEMASKKASMQAKAEIMRMLSARVIDNTTTDLMNNGEEINSYATIITQMNIIPRTILEVYRKKNEVTEVKIIQEFDIKSLEENENN